MDTYSIGIDLGGTNLRIAVYTEDAGVVQRISIPTRVAAGPDAVVRDIRDAVENLRRQNLVDARLLGVGIGAPGPLILPEGRFECPPNLPGWGAFALGPALEDALQASVAVDNDANLAALAECVLGVGRTHGQKSLAMLMLGTGVGNGIILNGSIWHGMNGLAGEAGHITVAPEGEPCNCGNRGCLEAYASATGVRRLALLAIASGRAPHLEEVLRSSGDINAGVLYDLALAGNIDAIEIFAQVGRMLGIGLAGLITTLDLPLYTIGGGLSGAWDLFAEPMLQELRLRSYTYRLTEERLPQKARILRAELGADSGLLGACLLPFQNHSTSTASLQEVLS